MAKIEDLIARVADANLRGELARAVSELKRTQTFGLVFEQHIPEMTTVQGAVVTVGAVVQRSNCQQRAFERGGVP